MRITKVEAMTGIDLLSNTGVLEAAKMWDSQSIVRPDSLVCPLQ
jgi:hypothetical protein